MSVRMKFDCHLSYTVLSHFFSCFIIMGGSFGTSLFKQIFQKVFAKDAQNANFKMGFNATFEVKVRKERIFRSGCCKLYTIVLHQCSNKLKLCGVLGSCFH